MKKLTTLAILLTGIFFLSVTALHSQTYLWNEEFNPDLSGIDTVSVVGSQTWVHATYGNDNNCAKMSGYSSGSQYANEDWVISPVMDLTNYTDVNLLFSEAINYSGGAINDRQEIMVSTDYSGDPSSATWTELTVTNRSSGSTWSFNDVDTVDLSSYAGNSSVAIGFKYTCDTIDAATWEIDYVHVFGYTASSPSMSFSTKSMSGLTYELGNGPSEQDTLRISANNIQDSLYFTAPANYEISLDAQSGYSNTLMVDDTSGSIGNAQVYVRLKDGLAADYYTGYLKVVTTGAQDSIELIGNVSDPSVLWNEEFIPDLGGVDTTSVMGEQTWVHDNYGNDDNCAKMNGYAGSAVVNEDWIVSPDMDFSGRDSLKMVFAEAINYEDPAVIQDREEVYVSTDYNGDPAAATWTEISVSGRAPGDSWSFTQADTVDLSAYAGEPKVNVAFKYTSTDSSAGTWEIDYVKVMDLTPTGIEESQKDLITNPVVIDKNIKFDLKAEEEMAIQLYNMNGQMIRTYSSKQFNGSVSIPIQDLSRQIIILTVQGQKSRQSFKLFTY